MAEAAMDQLSMRPSPSKLVDKEAPSMHQMNMRRPVATEELEFDVMRIRNILGCSTEFVLSENYSDEFALPAFINHCLPNVSIRKFGKSMFVYAARDMESGSAVVWLRAVATGGEKVDDCHCQRCHLEKKLEEPLWGITNKFMELLADERLMIEQCGDYIQVAVDLKRC